MGLIHCCCAPPGYKCTCSPPGGLPPVLNGTESGYGTAFTLNWVSGCIWKGCTVQVPITYGFFGSRTAPWYLTFTYDCTHHTFAIQLSYYGENNAGTYVPKTGTCATVIAPPFAEAVPNWTLSSSSISFTPFNATATYALVGTGNNPYNASHPPGGGYPNVTLTVTP